MLTRMCRSIIHSALPVNDPVYLSSDGDLPIRRMNDVIPILLNIPHRNNRLCVSPEDAAV